MSLDLAPFDAADYLATPEAVEAYLADALADADPAEFTHALGVVSRSAGMTQIARDAGVARPALYRALSAEGHPEFATVLKVLAQLGLRFRLERAA